LVKSASCVSAQNHGVVVASSPPGRSSGARPSRHVRFLDEFVRRQPDGVVVGLFVMQLDKLNRIATTFGRARADRLCARVVEQVRLLLPPGSPVIRLPERHIAMHVSGTSIGVVFQVANRIMNKLDPRVVDGGETFNVTSNVGIAYFPDHGNDASTLYRHAEMALGHAKDKDIPIHVYQNDATGLQRSLWRFESDLMDAVNARQLEVYYQPQYSLEMRRVSGAEALVRWRRPSGELMQAAEFIPAAERSGVIVPLTWFVFEEVANAVGQWKAARPPFAMAVNVPSRILSEPEFDQRVGVLHTALRKYGMELKLELTEEGLVQGGQQTLDRLCELRDGGIGLSIDDFGQGYSSLNYLKSLPASEIKIDKQFVTDMALDPRDEHIVKTTIDLARAFDMETVAEGVDNAESLRLLVELECATVQGFLIARPMNASALAEWLRSDSLDMFRRALARSHKRVVNR
jgi:EAL domain-containing protein (putative c-di-GMP-specific phosphodiesterase class I)/GGDEF domain-containing protein